MKTETILIIVGALVFGLIFYSYWNGKPKGLTPSNTKGQSGQLYDAQIKQDLQSMSDFDLFQKWGMSRKELQQQIA